METRGPQAGEARGTLEVALAHAARLLERDAAAAAEQAAAILKAYPDQPNALAISGLALGALGQGEEAIAALRRAVHLKPDLPDAWRALGDHYSALEMREAADAAFAQHLRWSTRDPRLMGAALALAENRIPDAESQLREHLKRFPTDVLAIRMLAEVAARIGRAHDAEALLARCVELAPGFRIARQNYAMVLHRQNKWAAALREVDHLLVDEPANPGLRNLKAAVLGRVGEYHASIELYRAVLRDYPRQPKVWMSLGHALKTANHNAEAIEAYRRCIELAPEFGEVWWSLANLKTFRFTPRRDRHHARAARARRSHQRRPLPLSFHAGQGAGRCRRICRLVRSLRAGQCAASQADPLRRGRECRARDAARAGCSRVNFSPRAPARVARRRDPIFIVGLPRSGSTLVEQILASHSHGRRHAGVAGHHHDRARRGQPDFTRGGQCLSARTGEVSRPTSCAPWASAT